MSVDDDSGNTTAAEKPRRNCYRIDTEDGRARVIALCCAMLEAQVFHEGQSKGVFDTRALAAVTEVVATKLNGLKTKDGSSLFVPALAATEVGKQWQKALRRAQEVKRQTPANGASWPGVNPQLSAVWQQMLERQQQSQKKRADGRARAATQEDFKKKRRENALKRVASRSPRRKKVHKASASRSRDDLEDDDCAATSDDDDAEKPTPRKRQRPRDSLQGMATAVESMLKVMQADIEQTGATTTPGANRLRDRLQELQQLHDAEMITGEEYQAARQKALGI